MSAKPKHVNELRFDIDVLVRYHNRRRAYFDKFHRIIAGVNIFGGSAAAVTFWAFLKQNLENEQTYFAWAAIIATLVIAILNAYDVVTGVAVRGRVHDHLYRRYVELDEMIVRAGEDETKLKEWEADLLLIERDEPAIYNALFVMCQNEAASVWKLEDHSPYKVSWLQATFSNMLRMAHTEFSQKHAA